MIDRTGHYNAHFTVTVDGVRRRIGYAQARTLLRMHREGPIRKSETYTLAKAGAQWSYRNADRLIARGYAWQFKDSIDSGRLCLDLTGLGWTVAEAIRAHPRAAAGLESA